MRRLGLSLLKAMRMTVKSTDFHLADVTNIILVAIVIGSRVLSWCALGMDVF